MQNRTRNLIFLILAIGAIFLVPRFWAQFNPSVPEQKTPKAYQETLSKGDFSINIPKGWQVNDKFPGIIARIANLNYQPKSSELKNFGFVNYFTIGYGVMGEGMDMKKYVEKTKVEGKQGVPDLKFTADRDLKINGYDAHIIESDAAGNGYNLKVAIALIKGKENSVWSIVFNTEKESWPEYKQIFEETINSFYIK